MLSSTVLTGRNAGSKELGPESTPTFIDSPSRQYERPCLAGLKHLKRRPPKEGGDAQEEVGCTQRRCYGCRALRPPAPAAWLKSGQTQRRGLADYSALVQRIP